MSLPFTREQFLDVFRQYNDVVWPVQFVLFALGVMAAALLFVRRPWRDMAIAGILAALWGWMGVVYHLLFFATINSMAVVFGAAFIAAAAGFACAAPRLRFEVRADLRSALGMALLAAGLVIHPLASLAAYPEAPTFGLPCPTTLFTIGLLAFLRPPYSGWHFAVPLCWSLIGLSAAVALRMPQDLLLIAAAGAGAWLSSADATRSAT